MKQHISVPLIGDMFVYCAGSPAYEQWNSRRPEMRRVTKLRQVLDPSQLICHLSVADEILLKTPPRASRADSLPFFRSTAPIAADDRATMGAIQRQG
jgi:hypothetical protein